MAKVPSSNLGRVIFCDLVPNGKGRRTLVIIMENPMFESISYGQGWIVGQKEADGSHSRCFPPGPVFNSKHDADVHADQMNHDEHAARIHADEIEARHIHNGSGYPLI